MQEHRRKGLCVGARGSSEPHIEASSVWYCPGRLGQEGWPTLAAHQPPCFDLGSHGMVLNPQAPMEKGEKKGPGESDRGFLVPQGMVPTGSDSHPKAILEDRCVTFIWPHCQAEMNEEH